MFFIMKGLFLMLTFASVVLCIWAAQAAMRQWREKEDLISVWRARLAVESSTAAGYFAFATTMLLIFLDDALQRRWTSYGGGEFVGWLTPVTGPLVCVMLVNCFFSITFKVPAGCLREHAEAQLQQAARFHRATWRALLVLLSCMGVGALFLCASALLGGPNYFK
jgi:hypothetical protein